MALEGYSVRKVEHAAALSFIREHHYAQGAANTSTFRFGLFDREERLQGVTLWMPPTKPAARRLTPHWTEVISLSRMAVAPDQPRNCCSFMLARAEKAIIQDGRYRFFLTYADEGEGHTGLVYLACNWKPDGVARPRFRWVDGEGRIVSIKATRNFTVDEMLARGYEKRGPFRRFRFARAPGAGLSSALLRLELELGELIRCM
jgi:hypothetical protein